MRGDFTVPVPDSAGQTIIDTLHKTIRRVRMVIAVKGICATLAVLMAGLLGAMAVDAGVVIFAAWPRWAMSGGVLGLTLLTAWLTLVRPLVKSFTLTGMARMLETKHPEMQERLSSAIQLLSSKDAPELRGSDQLIAALASEASTTAMGVQPRREVSLTAARPYIIAVGAVLAVLAGLLVLWPNKAATLLARAVAPNANIPNLRAGDLVMTPGQDVTIAEGDRLAVTVLVKNSQVESAAVRWIGPDGAERVQAMATAGTEGDSRRFAFTFPPAETNFRYRINAGDALSAYFTATVVARPQERSLVIRYEYPAYTHLAPSQEAGRQIKAVAGTLAQVTLQANKPLKSAALVIESAPRQVIDRQQTSDRQSATFLVPLTPKLRGAWTIELTDENDFHAQVGPYTIEAVEDLPPVVKLIKPDKSPLTLKRTDRLPLGYTMTDDFGLAGAQIIIKADAPSIHLSPVTVDLAALPAGKARRGVADTTMLDLSQFDLSDARTLTVSIRAVDALPADLGGPREGLSNSITISLDSNAPTYATQIQLADELIIRQVLEQVFKDLTDGKKDSAALYKVMPNLDTLNPPAVERIDRIRGLLTTDEKALRELADQLAAGSYAPLGDTLSALVKDHISVANEEAGKLKLTDSKKDRAAGADVVDFEIDRSLAIVGDLLKTLAVMTQEARRLQELADLAQKQEELAAEKAMLDAAKIAKGAGSQPASQSASQPNTKGNPFAAMSPAELEKATQQWQAKQAAMAKQLAELSRRTPGALGKRAVDRQQTTRDLISDAHELARTQAAVAAETANASKIAELDNALKALADRQADLAKQAQQADATKDATEPMKQAAKAIEDAQSKDAIKEHEQIEQQLKEKADNNQKERTAVDLASQAKQLAQRQVEIVKAVAASAASADKAQAAADAAATQAMDHTVAADKAKRELDKKLAELAKAQHELVKQAQDLEKKTADNPTLATARDVKPSATMAQAAGQMKHETLPQAQATAAQAATETKALGDKMIQASDAAKKQVDDPAAPVAATKQAQDATAATDKAAKDAQVAKDNIAVRDADSTKAQAAAKASQDKAVAAKTAADQAHAVANDKTKQATDAANIAAQAQQAAAAAKGPADQARAAAEQKDTVAKAAAAQAKAATDAANKARADAEAAKKANAPDAPQKEATAKAAEQQAAAANTAAANSATAAKQAAGDSDAAAKQATIANDKATQAAKTAADTKAVADQANKTLAAADAALAAANQQAIADAATANTAKAAAEKAKTDAQATDVVAKDAATRQADASAKAKDLTTNRDKTAKNAQAGQDAAKSAVTLAANQAKLANELADLAPAAKQVADARDAAAKAAAEHTNQARAHQEAKNQIVQQAANQQQVAQAAKQMAQAAENATPAAKDAIDKAAAGKATQQAAKDVQAGDNTKAAQSTDEAGKALTELAKALEKTQGDKPADPARQQADAQQIQDVAAKQAQIKNEAKHLLAQRDHLAKGQANAHETRLAAEQAVLARRAAELGDKFKQIAPQDDRLELAAARNAARADENLGSKSLPDAIREATTAGQRLDELAKRLGAEVNATSQPTSQVASRPAVAGSTQQEPDQLKTGKTAAEKRQALAEETANVARRQQQVARELADLEKGKLQELVKDRQQDVRDRTDDLAKDVGLVRDYSGDLVPDPSVKNAAEQAAQHMKAAQEQQAKAARELAKNTPASAVPSQQQSAAKLNEAAAALENLANQLTAIANKDPAPKEEAQGEESGHLAEATDKAEEAAVTKEQALADRAAKLLEELTQSASARALETGVMPMDLTAAKGKPTKAGQMPNPLNRANPQVFSLTQQELDAMGITVGDWSLLKGELRDQVLQGAADKSPEEYRELIKEYFDAVSKRGNETKK